jgi:hypothetical protein
MPDKQGQGAIPFLPKSVPSQLVTDTFDEVKDAQSAHNV